MSVSHGKTIEAEEEGHVRAAAPRAATARRKKPNDSSKDAHMRPTHRKKGTTETCTTRRVIGEEPHPGMGLYIRGGPTSVPFPKNAVHL